MMQGQEYQELTSIQEVVKPSSGFESYIKTNDSEGFFGYSPDLSGLKAKSYDIFPRTNSGDKENSGYSNGVGSLFQSLKDKFSASMDFRRYNVKDQDEEKSSGLLDALKNNYNLTEKRTDEKPAKESENKSINPEEKNDSENGALKQDDETQSFSAAEKEKEQLSLLEQLLSRIEKRNGDINKIYRDLLENPSGNIGGEEKKELSEKPSSQPNVEKPSGNQNLSESDKELQSGNLPDTGKKSLAFDKTESKPFGSQNQQIINNDKSSNNEKTSSKPTGGNISSEENLQNPVSNNSYGISKGETGNKLLQLRNLGERIEKYYNVEGTKPEGGNVTTDIAERINNNYTENMIGNNNAGFTGKELLSGSEGRAGTKTPDDGGKNNGISGNLGKLQANPNDGRISDTSSEENPPLLPFDQSEDPSTLDSGASIDGNAPINSGSSFDPLAKVEDKVENFEDTIQENIKNAENNIQTAFSEQEDSMKSAMSKIDNELNTSFEKMQTDTDPNSIQNNLKSKADIMHDGMQSKVGQIEGEFKSKIGCVAENLQSAMNNKEDTIQSAIDNKQQSAGNTGNTAQKSLPSESNENVQPSSIGKSNDNSDASSLLEKLIPVKSSDNAQSTMGKKPVTEQKLSSNPNNSSNDSHKASKSAHGSSFTAHQPSSSGHGAKSSGHHSANNGHNLKPAGRHAEKSGHGLRHTGHHDNKPRGAVHQTPKHEQNNPVKVSETDNKRNPKGQTGNGFVNNNSGNDASRNNNNKLSHSGIDKAIDRSRDAFKDKDSLNNKNGTGNEPKTQDTSNINQAIDQRFNQIEQNIESRIEDINRSIQPNISRLSTDIQSNMDKIKGDIGTKSSQIDSLPKQQNGQNQAECHVSNNLEKTYHDTKQNPDVKDKLVNNPMQSINEGDNFQKTKEMFKELLSANKPGNVALSGKLLNGFNAGKIGSSNPSETKTANQEQKLPDNNQDKKTGPGNSIDFKNHIFDRNKINQDNIKSDNESPKPEKQSLNENIRLPGKDNSNQNTLRDKSSIENKNPELSDKKSQESVFTNNEANNKNITKKNDKDNKSDSVSSEELLKPVQNRSENRESGQPKTIFDNCKNEYQKPGSSDFKTAKKTDKDLINKSNSTINHNIGDSSLNNQVLNKAGNIEKKLTGSGVFAGLPLVKIDDMGSLISKQEIKTNRDAFITPPDIKNESVARVRDLTDHPASNVNFRHNDERLKGDISKNVTVQNIDKLKTDPNIDRLGQKSNEFKKTDNTLINKPSEISTRKNMDNAELLKNLSLLDQVSRKNNKTSFNKSEISTSSTNSNERTMKTNLLQKEMQKPLNISSDGKENSSVNARNSEGSAKRPIQSDMLKPKDSIFNVPENGKYKNSTTEAVTKNINSQRDKINSKNNEKISGFQKVNEQNSEMSRNRIAYDLSRKDGTAYLLSNKVEISPKEYQKDTFHKNDSAKITDNSMIQKKAVENDNESVMPSESPTRLFTSSQKNSDFGKPEYFKLDSLKKAENEGVIKANGFAKSERASSNNQVFSMKFKINNNADFKANQKPGSSNNESISAINSAPKLISFFSASSAIHISPMADEIKKQIIVPQNKAVSEKPAQRSALNIITEMKGNSEKRDYSDDSQNLDNKKEEGDKKSQYNLKSVIKSESEKISQQSLAEQSIKESFHEKKIIDETVLQENINTDKKTNSENQKEMPVKQTDQAVKNAATSIESILKKSQSEAWTGDEMATKMIYLLMKASNDFTFDHSSRVVELSITLARQMGIKDDKQLNEIKQGAMFHDIGEVEMDLNNASAETKSKLSKYLSVMDLKNCSFLHDIGKVKIPDSILYKPSRLTDEEYNILKKHPVIGEEILKPIKSMESALPVVRHHHEGWNGKGYPDGLKGEEIPLSARIVSITDAFDAMISDRPYRKGMTVEDAVAELKINAGIQFDPQMVEAFLKVIVK